jgi:hypothetical protein
LTTTQKEAQVANGTKTKDARIPDVFANNPVLADLAASYLSTLDEVTEYNATYKVDRKVDPDAPTPNKMLAEAKKVREEDNEANSLLDRWEALYEEIAAHKQRIADYMAGKLGITLVAEVPKPDADATSALREQRKSAVELGKTMAQIATLTGRAQDGEALTSFLSANQLPEVGREGKADFTAETQTAPKYRVDVTARVNGNIVLSGDKGKGFTKAAQYGKQLHPGDNRQHAPSRDDFQKAWESAGNTPEKTVQSEVKFVTPDGVEYTIASRS